MGRFREEHGLEIGREMVLISMSRETAVLQFSISQDSRIGRR